MKAIHIIGILILVVIIIGGAAVLIKPSTTGNATAQEPIKIGATLPLTGDIAEIGTSIQNAMKLAT